MIDYKRLKEIVFLLWDNKEAYELPDTQVRIGSAFKNKHRVYDENGFHLHEVLKQYEDSPQQEFIFFIHLDHNNSIQNRGQLSFDGSETLAQYPNLKFYYVSRAERDRIYKEKINITVHSWDNIKPGIDRDFVPQTVAEMLEASKILNNPRTVSQSRPVIKYAIFTALFDEFIEVEKLFEFDNKLTEETDTIIYKIGKLRGTDKYVVACFAGKTGMTEAAVICTEMINRYNPLYILMPGVCGGADSTEFGNVIIANKVFLLGKGKIKDIKDKEGNPVQLYYDGQLIDLKKITRGDSVPVRVIAEELEKETELIETDEKIISKITSHRALIENKINEHLKGPNEKIKLQIDPMACSLSVIDKEDYFEIDIKGHERKTKAVEMESYGVARAAKKANGGQTKFLIFKSVMDKTTLKNDDYKEKAAYTSAQFLKHILEEGII